MVPIPFKSPITHSHDKQRLLSATILIFCHIYYSIGKGKVLLCGSCMGARGLSDGEFLDGAERSTMAVLAQETEHTDKFLVFLMDEFFVIFSHWRLLLARAVGEGSAKDIVENRFWVVLGEH